MSEKQANLTALLSSSFLIVLGLIFSSVGRLIERIIIAHRFSIEAYGELTLMLAIMTIGSTVSLLGLNSGIPRYVSRFENEADIRGVVLTGFVSAFVISVGVAAILFQTSGQIIKHLFDVSSSQPLLVMFIITVPISVGLTIGVSLLRGLENTRYKLYSKDLLYPGLRIVLILLFIVGGYGLRAVGYSYLIATGISLLIVFIFAHRLVPLVGSIELHTRELISFSAPLIVTMLLGALLTRMDTLMLGYYRPSTEVGLYNAAYPLANSLLMVVSSFGYLYLPLTSRLDSKGKRNELAEIYQITTKWGYILTFPAFLLFVFFSNDILSLFFGSKYSEAGIALTILSFGFFTSAAAGRNRSTLAALGHTKDILWTDIITLGANFALNIVLIPHYGFTGAAIASAAAFIIRNIVLCLLLHVKNGIQPLNKYVTKTFITLPLVLGPLTFGAAQTLSLTIVLLPLALVVLGLLTLIVVTFTGCLESDDRVVVELIEQTTGISVPLVFRYIPTPE